MAYSFNVFSGTLDQVGSGAVVFEGEVETFADLPEAVGDPAVGASYLVRESTGVWLVNRRQAGIWIRRNNTGVRATDWEYGGDYPVNSVNGQTGDVSLTASSVGAAAATHASTHHTGGSDALTPTNISAQWSQVASNQTITTNTVLSAGRNRRIVLFSVGATANVDLPWENNQNGDMVTLVADFTLPSTLTIRTASVMGGSNPVAYITLTTLTASGQSYTFVSSGTATGWTLRNVDTHAHAAADITSGTFDNARINFAAPPAIGNTTPNSGAFTTLTAQGDGTNALVATFGAADGINNTIQIWGNGANRNHVIGGGGANGVFFRVAAGANHSFLSTSGIRTASTLALGWTSTSNADSGTFDTQLFRDAADTVAQRRDTNPQTFRIYNTFTDASNYERGFMRWSSNVLQIGTEKAGTGSARALALQTDGITRVTVDTTGQVGIGVAPERPFHIQGSTAFARIDRQGSVGPAILLTRMATGTTVTSSWLFGPTDQVAGVVNDDFAIIDFGTAVSGTSGTQRLTISKSTGQLTVNGNLNLSTKDLVTDTTTGTKIGTGTTQKLGFFNATPIVRPAAIADATDAATTQARLNDLLAAMRSLGLIAT